MIQKPNRKKLIISVGNLGGLLMNNENKNDEFVFLTPMDVAKIIGCSVPTARKLFYRDDFPAIKVGKNLKVLKLEFIKWCSERRM